MKIRKIKHIQKDTSLHSICFEFFGGSAPIEELLPLMKFSIDVASEAVYWIRPDASIIYVNDAAVKFLGYSRNQLLKMKVMDFDPIYNNKTIWDRHWRAIKKRKFFTIETIHRDKKGHEHYVEISINYIVYNGKEYNFAFAKDITERKKTEEELKKFKLAVESASDQIVLADPNFKIIYANDGVERITGYSAKEVIGKTPRELWSGKMPRKFYEKMEQTLKKNKQVFTAEINCVRKNDGDYIAETKITPILNDEGEIVYFLSVERDITKVKEIDKMKTEFVSVASHQLRTPLTAIKWYVEMLAQGKAGELNGKQKDFLTEIKRSNERMIRLVSDLLDVSRIETGEKFVVEKKLVDIVKPLKILLTDLSIIAEKKKVNMHFCDKSPLVLKVKADAKKILQVFQNLVSNAIKFTPAGGEVEIGCRKLKKEVEFFIKDNGIGIPPSQQHRVFEKFFRADNAIQADPDGTGLGLYIAKAVIEAHGGKIWFESKKGMGTQFNFTLPLGRG